MRIRPLLFTALFLCVACPYAYQRGAAQDNLARAFPGPSLLTPQPIDPNEAAFNAAVKQLRASGVPLIAQSKPTYVDTSASSIGVKAFGLFSSPGGPISVEVQREMPDQASSRPVVYVGRPLLRMVGGLAVPVPGATQWHKFVFSDDKLVAAEDGDQPPGPPTQPLLVHTRDWSQDKDADPANYILSHGPFTSVFVDMVPHWLPIIPYETPLYKDNDYENIFRFMQKPAQQADATNLINKFRTPEKADLADRATRYWPPARLRGVAAFSEMSDGDFPAVHALDYMDSDGSLRTGLPWPPSETYPKFRGADWLIDVEPDLAFRYLASLTNPDPLAAAATVRVEIEQFALPPPFRPRAGEWVEATGRWVVDAGHSEWTIRPELQNNPAAVAEFNAAAAAFKKENEPDLLTHPELIKKLSILGEQEFHSEIHPAELVVSARAGCAPDDPSFDAPSGFNTCPGASSSVYRVMATGANSGERLFFVVNPPPRPNPAAVLHYQLMKSDGTLCPPDEKYDNTCFDDIAGLKMTVKEAPANGPNHLFVEIESLDKSKSSYPFADGVVGMRRDVRLECYIKCFWTIPTTSLRGKVTVEGQPATRAYVFYRDASAKDVQWQAVRADSKGDYNIPNLAAGSYWVRPAGSDYDFADVPALVPLMAGVNQRDFKGKKESYANYPPPTPTPTPKFSTTQPSLQPAQTPLQPANPKAAAFLRSELFHVQEDVGPFGVYVNQLGYKTNAMIVVHLSRLEDDDQKAVKDFQSAYTETVSGLPPDPSGGGGQIFDNFTLKGTPTGGVGGAQLRATLVLGGYHRVGTVTALTNEDGNATFLIHGGQHAESVRLEIEVLSNPYNTWFLPSYGSELYLFNPSRGGDDFTVFVLTDSHKPYVLEVGPPFNSSSSPMSARQREFIEENSERERLSVKLRPRAAELRSLKPVRVVPKRER